MAIRADILAVPRAERATLKGIELARLTARSAARLSGDIEVRSLTAVPHGVEVMIRAWNGGGRARGFGDGTVEIERIRIINPPICVPDPLGPIDLDWRDDDGVLHARRFREDLDEAIFQALDHILRVAPTHGHERIVPGKVGRTVSTFYAGGGDGWINGEDAVWATAHGAATGTTANDTGITMRVASNGFSAPFFEIRRVFVPFVNTSDLPDTDVISDATCSLYVTSKDGNGDNDGDDFFALVGPTTQASDTALTTADFDQSSTSELSADRKDYSAITAPAYADWILNATGIAAINKTGPTKFGVREGHDLLNSAVAQSDVEQQIRFASSEDGGAGTTQDPVLVVTHAAASSILPLVAKDMQNIADIQDMRG